MKLRVVLNGGETWDCDRHPNTHLSKIALDVLSRAGVDRHRWALMDWEIRDVKGVDLEFHRSMRRNRIHDGQTLYLSPRPGAGA